MPRETPSPLDLPGPEHVGRLGLGWTSGAIVTAAAFLLLTNAVSLQGWIDEQRPGPLQSAASAVAEWWGGVTDAVGLSAPRAALHARWKQAEAARFGGTDAAGAKDQR